MHNRRIGNNTGQWPADTEKGNEWRKASLKLYQRILIILSLVCLWATVIMPIPVVIGAGSECADIADEAAPFLSISLDNPPIKDAQVQGLQFRLQELGYYKGPDDGVYDREMAAAVKAFQQDQELSSDGLIGEKTWQALADTYTREVTNTNENPTGQVTLQVDIPNRTLTVFSDGVVFRVFPVAVGKTTTPSPVGEWKIVNKGAHWGTGFGTRWMGLNVPWGVYGIHGTNKPWSIGTKASHGCIRMRNQDVEVLYNWVAAGTVVKMTGPLPQKAKPPKLQKGQANQDVVSLQFLLQQAGLYNNPADGRFGEQTEQAVLRFQAIEGLPENGIVDAEVWKALWEFVNQQSNVNEPN